MSASQYLQALALLANQKRGLRRFDELVGIRRKTAISDRQFTGSRMLQLLVSRGDPCIQPLVPQSRFPQCSCALHARTSLPAAEI